MRDSADPPESQSCAGPTEARKGSHLGLCSHPLPQDRQADSTGSAPAQGDGPGPTRNFQPKLRRGRAGLSPGGSQPPGFSPQGPWPGAERRDGNGWGGRPGQGGAQGDSPRVTRTGCWRGVRTRSQARAPPWGTLCIPTSVSAGEPGRACPAGSTGTAGPASTLSPPHTSRGAPPAPSSVQPRFPLPTHHPLLLLGLRLGQRQGQLQLLLLLQGRLVPLGGQLGADGLVSGGRGRGTRAGGRGWGRRAVYLGLL